MADYSTQKVPELKKLLVERSLSTSGNKADLIARLEEHDKKASSSGGGEDEIDWDEDDTKATTAPAAAATAAAGGQGQVANPAAVLNQKVDTDPAATSDLKVVVGGEPKSTKVVAPASETPVAEATPAEPKAPKQDFTAGISKSDVDKEAEKRAARAKRFGIAPTTEAEEAAKKAERAKKFGLTSGAEEIVKGLDSALPERRAKRGREDKGEQAGRNTKRQTPDRRTGPAGKQAAGKQAPTAKKSVGKIIDDPAEKAKAEARAKRFQAAA